LFCSKISLQLKLPHSSSLVLGPLAVIARCDYVYLLSPVCDKGAAYVCIMQSALSLFVSVCGEGSNIYVGEKLKLLQLMAEGNKSRNIFCPNETLLLRCQ